MDLLPHFGIIKYIVVFNSDEFYFICEVLLTQMFAHHFHSFSVNHITPIQFHVCQQADFYDYTMLSLYETSDNKCYIPFKYQLIDFL